MSKDAIKKIKYCRLCKKNNLVKVLTLGPTPLANAFLTKTQCDQPEIYYPLDVYFCRSCTLVQLGHVVNPKVLFANYVYASSTSPVFVKHFEDFANTVIDRYFQQLPGLVVDIGSNDGILLQHFRRRGCKILGIEPAKNIARLAQKKGVPTLSAFFNQAVAKKIVKKVGQATIITATNVFAHIDDLDEVMHGVKILLKRDGIFIIEVPHLAELIRQNLFDTIYHEHLSYFALAPLLTYFRGEGMRVIAVEKVASHGGSLRIFVTSNKSDRQVTNSVAKIIMEEIKLGLAFLETYRNFAKQILINKASLISLLSQLVTKGYKIAGYGAPAKGNTLLNFFNIGCETLDFIVDDSPLKQGLYTPGKRIPVLSSHALYEKKPDYLLILAWNFSQSIVEKNERFKKIGGKFVIPVPIPKII